MGLLKHLRRVISDSIRVAALLASAALCPPAHAQSTASIEGQVTDQNGAVVSGVEIMAVSRESGVKRTVRTDGAGRFQIAALAVGTYRIEVRADGFQTEVVESAALEV